MYAGFWIRAIAFLLDIFIILGFLSALGEVSDISKSDLLPISILVMPFYWILFEGSPLQATPGKMAFGVKVSNVNAGHPGWGRTIGRNLAKIISYITWGIGFVMAGFTERKQALHDKIAGCLVIDNKASKEDLTPEEETSGCLIALIIVGGLFLFALFSFLVAFIDEVLF